MQAVGQQGDDARAGALEGSGHAPAEEGPEEARQEEGVNSVRSVSRPARHWLALPSAHFRKNLPPPQFFHGWGSWVKRRTPEEESPVNQGLNRAFAKAELHVVRPLRAERMPGREAALRIERARKRLSRDAVPI